MSRRCGAEGRHPIPDGEGVRSCACGLVTRHPAQPKETR